jgi:hypothetical protein
MKNCWIGFVKMGMIENEDTLGATRYVVYRKKRKADKKMAGGAQRNLG